MDTESILKFCTSINIPKNLSYDKKHPFTKDEEITYIIRDKVFCYDISENESLQIAPPSNKTLQITKPTRFEFISFLPGKYVYIMRINHDINNIYKEYLEEPSLWILTHGKLKIPDILRDVDFNKIIEFSKFLQRNKI